MNRRTLGPNGPEVSEIGLGCMGMSAFYGATDEGEARRTIQMALDEGCNFLDTADMYGPYTNERLLGGAIAGRREEVFLATKFGIKLIKQDDPVNRTIDGRPEYVREACDASLERLGVQLAVADDHVGPLQIDRAVPVREPPAGRLDDRLEGGHVPDVDTLLDH